MLNNKNTTLQSLYSLGLSLDEAKLYVELLKGPANHLELSRSTGINRTKIYRLADDLEKKSLLSQLTDDQGTRLIAEPPEALEIALVNSEEKLKNQRAILRQVTPTLQDLQKSSQEDPESFVVQTYEGVEGFKQMLWHELKTTGEILVFANGSLESLVDSTRWAERHRAKSIEAGYEIRELLNPGGKPEKFTKHDEFLKQYNKRYIDPELLYMQHQVCIYNDTVATYNWRGNQKVGVEIINRANTKMMRQVFETYWKLAAC